MPEEPPTKRGFKSVTLGGSSAVAVQESLFSGNSTVYEWSAQVRNITFTLPQMEPENALEWVGWMRHLNHTGKTFWFYAPLYVLHEKPLGLPQLDGAGQTGRTMHVKNCAVESYNLFRRGRFFEISGRLHEVTEDASTDALGKASVSIWPAMQNTSTEDGEEISYSEPRGEFRMLTPSLEVEFGTNKLSREITFSAREVVRRS